MLLIIYRDRMSNCIEEVEVEFQPHHFQHLTGIRLTEVDQVTGLKKIRQHTAMEFYRRCIGKPYITVSEIEFVDYGTIDLKMMALPYITQITKITKMAGEFEKKSKKKLEADYIIGGEKSCIAISKSDDSIHFYPRSCLKENIKQLTNYTSQVLAIFQKPINSNKKYKDIKYVTKGRNLTKLSMPVEIATKISLEEYRSPQ